MLKRVISDEKGRILVWTLVILALGTLLIPPLLARVSANLIASRAIEEGLKEQYAADSGVEYAMLQLQHGITASQNPYTYTINNKAVDVTWGEYPAITDTYKITSTATSQIDGSSTTIESYISLSMLDYSWLLDNAITSISDVELSPGSEVSGTVQYGGELDNKGTITPPPGGAEAITNWPPTGVLSGFYFGQVEDLGLVLDPYPDDTIDVKDTNSIGPLYRVGDLDILSSQNGATAVLSGTVYVTGNLDVGKTDQDFTLNLNGEAIYVEGNIDIGGKCTISGSGIIIAEGNVFFSPKTQSNPDDFVFVMSTEGWLQMQPNGDFYGSVAGDVEVDLQPGAVLTWRPPPAGLNFPDGTTGGAHIRTYKIYP